MSIYAVLRRLGPIFRQYRCLDDATLDRYMRGKLRDDPEAYDRAIAHLGICEECQERLSRYADGGDGEGLEEHLVE